MMMRLIIGSDKSCDKQLNVNSFLYVLFNKLESTTKVVCRPTPPNHLIPTEKPFLFLFSRWDVVCL